MLREPRHLLRATSRSLPRCLLLATCLLLAACREQTGPDTPAGLFDRYVALGNSITAGFESDGINDSTQAHAYPAVLASRVGAPFAFAPLLRPGCPPPLAGPTPMTSARVGGASALSCAGVGTVPRVIQNVGLPGARIGDALTVPGGLPGLLYTSIFGNRTPLEAVLDARPTLVTVWLGNNDVLDAALAADASRLTSVGSFRGSLERISEALRDQTRAQEVVLIGVANPMLVPLLQPGAYYWAAANLGLGGYFLPKPVDNDCAPGLGGAAPGAGATNLVSYRAVTSSAVGVISCAAGAPFVVDANLRQTITNRVAAFNAALETEAADRGWTFVDPNTVLDPLADQPQGIRLCQTLRTGLTQPALINALAVSCPHPDAPNFFGSLISFDGYHPSAEAQALIADALLAALAARHPVPN